MKNFRKFRKWYLFCAKYFFEHKLHLFSTSFSKKNSCSDQLKTNENRIPTLNLLNFRPTVGTCCLVTKQQQNNDKSACKHMNVSAARWRDTRLLHSPRDACWILLPDVCLLVFIIRCPRFIIGKIKYAVSNIQLQCWGHWHWKNKCVKTALHQRNRY